MWYPLQQQQPSCHGYPRHFSSQPKQQAYLRTSYYYNRDELLNTPTVPTNDVNESFVHCQSTYGSNTHVNTDCYVTSSTDSYVDEMSRIQTRPIQNAYWDPVIAAPARMSVATKDVSIITPPITTSTSTSPSSSSLSLSCWNWLLFSPQYYSEFYSSSSTNVQHSQQKRDEEKDDDNDFNFLTSLPTCLLALLYLTPTLMRQSSNDENENEQEISTIHDTEESSLSINNIDENINNISSNLSLSSDNKNSNLNVDHQQSKQDRSSTPDTDDGYQSANDVSRSDCSQQSSLPDDHHNSKDNIISRGHSVPPSSIARGITYAAAVKPTTALTNKISSSIMSNTKSKQTNNNTLLKTAVTDANNMLNIKGQKLKFIAPRFERMHQEKQYSTSSNTSNRMQIRSTNNNPRNPTVHSVRRR